MSISAPALLSSPSGSLSLSKLNLLPFYLRVRTAHWQKGRCSAHLFKGAEAQRSNKLVWE